MIISGSAAIIVILFGIVLFSKESPAVVGTRFMAALAKGDAKTLTDLSYLGTESKDSVGQKWDFTVNRAGKHYQFAVRILRFSQSSDDSASVAMEVVRNARNSSAYPEKFELPMVKTSDGWKVDYRGINREMYPGLPR